MSTLLKNVRIYQLVQGSHAEASGSTLTTRSFVSILGLETRNFKLSGLV